MGGLFVKHHQYTSLQYCSVALVTTGILAYNLTGGKSGGTDTFIGLMFLALALVADGLNSYFVVSAT